MARHFMVIVTEGPEDDRRDSIVLAEPLERVNKERTAFAHRNHGYVVSAEWQEIEHDRPEHGQCLHIGVARADFNASGCVATDRPVADVGRATLENGTSVDVTVWFFDAEHSTTPPMRKTQKRRPDPPGTKA